MGLGFLYNDTVTLYNKSIDKQTGEEHWFPTLIEGASLLFKSNTTVDKNGKKSADEAKLFVDTCTLQKPYAKPKEWNDMPDDQKAVSFTFNVLEDFFVEGNTMDTAILQQGFFDWMRNHYDNVFKIVKAEQYKNLMPHFEVRGV